jgi:hypothetical protein
MTESVPSLEEANARVRRAVQARTAAEDHSQPGHGQTCRVAFDRRPSASDVVERFGMLPGAPAYREVLEELWRLHRQKAADYGSTSDPLRNIRSGAEFVGIEPWRAAMVRIADKVTRLATHNCTGSLRNEGVEDTLLDLASYAIIALVLFREGAEFPASQELANATR